jgi:hypothetical protein
VSLWPFVTVRADAERTEVEVLGPLGFYRRTPEETAFGLRPLFTFHRDVAKGWSTWQFLYPLSYFRTEATAGRYFVLPLYYRSWRTTPSGRHESANTLFPLVWWGHAAGSRDERAPPSATPGGPWFVVAFLGGVCKGLLGQDQIVHVSWLYNRASWRGYVQHHVLWPFFSWSTDGQGHRSLRIWPLYGSSQDKGQWWNGFVLWPFVTYGERESAKGKEAARFWMLWPLYGQSRSRDGQSGSFQALWPFFSYAWNKTTGYRAWRAPFPIVLGSREERVRTTNVWPLWGQQRWPGGVNRYTLWPLVHTSRVRARNSEADDLKVFPFFTRATSRRTDEAERRSFVLFWPLWRAQFRQKGEEWRSEANSLQFAWFAQAESFDRTFNPLLGLFEREAGSDGTRATRLLWRMLRFERSPEGRRVQLGPLASWSSSARLTKMSFLLGLIQTGQREGRRGWRLFTVPFGASLADALPTARKDAARGR